MPSLGMLYLTMEGIIPENDSLFTFRNLTHPLDIAVKGFVMRFN
jgi:hypothetical protein